MEPVSFAVDLDDDRPFRTVGVHDAPNYFPNGTSWAPAHAGQ